MTRSERIDRYAYGGGYAFTSVFMALWVSAGFPVLRALYTAFLFLVGITLLFVVEIIFVALREEMQQ